LLFRFRALLHDLMEPWAVVRRIARLIQVMRVDPTPLRWPPVVPPARPKERGGQWRAVAVMALAVGPAPRRAR
jgi:hypothetical protein